MLSVVQAIVMRTLTGERPLQEARDALLARLHALGRVLSGPPMQFLSGR